MKILFKHKLVLFGGLVVLFNILFISSNVVYASSNDDNDQNFGNVLVISSYTLDSKRVVDFMREFNTLVEEHSVHFTFIMENMGYKDLGGCAEWEQMMQECLDKYKNSDLKGLILLGQEAWCSYLSLDEHLNVPFYGCYISKNGVLLPSGKFNIDLWNPEHIDTQEYAKSIGHCGGIINTYDLHKNINLIKVLYPSIKRIAFLSDNTYGGVSVQAMVKKVMAEDYKDWELDLLDGRKYLTQEIKDKIKELPKNTALLIGTWRVDKSGTFFLQNSIEDLLSSDNKMPIFTLTGTGFGSVAMGGYYPEYKINIGFIVEDLMNYHNDKVSGCPFINTENKYKFFRDLLNKYAVKDYQLPAHSVVIESDYKEEIKKYKQFLLTGSILLIFIILGFSISIIMYIKHRKLIKVLKLQQSKLENQQTILHKQTELLEVAKEDAVRSDKLKSAFLANMSHEIRTPLHAIVGFSDLLIEADSDAKRGEYQGIIRTNAELLLKLIGDILDLSKIEAGYIDVKMQEFSLYDTFKEVFVFLQQRIDKPDVQLVFDCPSGNYTIEYDRNRFVQIINNFVTNSIKHTNIGSITMGFNIIDNGLKIFVKDTGLGIPEDKKDKVFSRFEKFDNFSQGTGLGLSICKAIVDATGGYVGFESTLGKGSSFWAWLPVKITEIAGQDSPSHHTPLITSGFEPELKQKIKNNTSNLRGPLILVAEDNDSNYLLISTILKDYQLIRAVNGVDAVELFKNNTYDLILMDINMPIMGGLEATAAIREINKQIPIIAVTANAYDSDKKEILNAGCNGVIAKPYKIQELLDSLKKWLS